ncbi:hypothetical protein EGT07_02435 [Herbaspirillum sp. HC18]|nr:hypothetical protein EGT07_02435 [Herbaspirillum sp. HC18]
MADITATISLERTALKVGETSTITITFSEAVLFDNDDLTVDGGSLSQVTSSDGITWLATFTPSANLESATNVISLANTYSPVDVGAGNSPTPLVSDNYAIDTIRPTATVALADSALAAGDTTTVTITFSEVPTGFVAADDLTVANGTLSAGTFDGTGKIYTATFTPTADVEDTSNVITLGTGWSDAAGNAPAATADSANYTIDTKAPTATVALADSALAAGDTTTVTITFSEVPTGFVAADDLTVANGTLSAGTFDGTGKIYTATFTPTADVEDTSNVITLGTGWSDAAGNAPAATADSANYTIDTKAPTTTISNIDISADTGTSDSDFRTNTAAQTITATLSAGLNAGEKLYGSVDGGVVFTDITSKVNGTAVSWNGAILSSGDIILYVNDGNGNAGTAATRSYVLDTTVTAPTFALATDSGTNSDGITNVGTVNVTGVESGGTWQYSTDGGTTWSAAQPAATTSFTLAAGTYAAGKIRVKQTDLAGNTSTEVQSGAQIIVDAAAPTALTITKTDVDTSNSYTAGDKLTITFSEAVASTLALSDLTVGAHAFGTGASLTAKNVVGGKATTFDIELGTGTTVAAGDIISVDKTKLADTAGNTPGSNLSFTVPTADSTAPALATNPGENCFSIVDKTITLHFNEDLVNAGDAAALKAAVKVSTDGTHFVALGASDTVSLLDETLTVTFSNMPISDTTKLQIGAGAIKDAAGNATLAAITSSAIDTKLIGTAVADTQYNTLGSTAEIVVIAPDEVMKVFDAAGDQKFGGVFILPMGTLHLEGAQGHNEIYLGPYASSELAVSRSGTTVSFWSMEDGHELASIGTSSAAPTQTVYIGDGAIDLVYTGTSITLGGKEVGLVGVNLADLNPDITITPPIPV